MTIHRFLERLALRLGRYHRSVRLEDACARLGSLLVERSRKTGEVGCFVLDLNAAEGSVAALDDHCYRCATMHARKQGAKAEKIAIERPGPWGYGVYRFAPRLDESVGRVFVEGLKDHELVIDAERDFRWMPEGEAVEQRPELAAVLGQYDTRYECVVVLEHGDAICDGLVVRQQEDLFTPLRGSLAERFFVADLFSLDGFARRGWLHDRKRLVSLEGEAFWSPTSSHVTEVLSAEPPFLRPDGTCVDAGPNLNAGRIWSSSPESINLTLISLRRQMDRGRPWA